MKRGKIRIIALEQSKKSTNLKKLPLGSRTSKSGIALILGNEVNGVPESVLQSCDKIIEIPMRGKKESLNVSVAAGIALWEINKKFP